MNKLIPAALLALSLALAPTFAHAKAGAHAKVGAHAGKHHGKLAKMATKLGLTDAQKAQIKPIIKARHQQAKAIKADTSLTPEAKKAQIKALRQNTRSQIMPLLTPDQQAEMAPKKGHHHKKAV